MSEYSDLTYICNFCKARENKMDCCSKCKIVLYCSKDCQINDWGEHKTKCTPDAKNEGIETRKTMGILSKNKKFLQVMMSICSMHWSENSVIRLSLIKKGLMINV